MPTNMEIASEFLGLLQFISNDGETDEIEALLNGSEQLTNLVLAASLIHLAYVDLRKRQLDKIGPQIGADSFIPTTLPDNQNGPQSTN